MLKKINCLFRYEGIFDFLYLSFNTITFKSNESDRGQKNSEQWYIKTLFFLMVYR
jgi:hypothetical protein